jgi:hypothetical protein
VVRSHTPDSLDLTADQEFLVLDADSSQQRAIRGVCGGKSGMIRAFRLPSRRDTLF